MADSSTPSKPIILNLIWCNLFDRKINHSLIWCTINFPLWNRRKYKYNKKHYGWVKNIGYFTVIKSFPVIAYKLFKKNERNAIVLKIFLTSVNAPFSDNNWSEREFIF